MSENRRKILPSFGTYRKRRLNDEKQKLVQELLPEISISEDFTGAPENLFQKKYKEIILEIGFGDGGHLAAQALRNKDSGFIGSEIYINGIASLLKKISDEKIENIKVFREDARIFLEKIPDESLDKIFILFPDPWPKAKHHKRRLVSQGTLELLHKKLKAGGFLRLATDWPDYASWMIIQVMGFGKFTWQAEDKTGWQKIPTDHITTKYQEKALAENRRPFFIDLINSTRRYAKFL